MVWGVKVVMLMVKNGFWGNSSVDWRVEKF